VAAFSGSPYCVVNDNVPYFQTSDLSAVSFDIYSELDSLGRCGTAYANISKDIMPTEKRGDIGDVRPSGFQLSKYDFVDGKYLFNRCHLIGYQLTGENANVKNLITGTRYLNVEGMLPFENMVADYIKETGNHVMYRVTPIFVNDELVSRGVLMEAESDEDSGAGICYNVYCYNVQSGVIIDYATGDNSLDPNSTEAGVTEESTGSDSSITEGGEQQSEETYIVNTNTRKFHRPGCRYAEKIKDSNREEFTGSRDQLISEGYSPCKYCNP
jgi:DNA-entry nuclease